MKDSFKDFAHQLMSGANTAKEFAAVVSDLKDIIDDVRMEIEEKRELERQEKIINVINNEYLK